MSFTLPKVINLGALLSKELPPARPVISPWLHSGESCLLWAGSGVGKSMLAQTLALAVAGGGKVLGWTYPEPARVLYVDGEQSVRAIQSRFRLLSTSIAGGDAAKAAANLVVMARATQEKPVGFLDIADEDQHTTFLRYIRENAFGLVVFDNLSTLTDKIEDENSAGAMKPMQALLTHLKKINVAVIVVHHAGKNSKAFRGSSNIATTFERILGVVRNETAPATCIDATATLDKFRDEVPEGFRPVFPVTFKTELQKDSTKRAVWEVGDLGQLEEAWRMFSTGSYLTKAAFVAAYNERYGTSHKAGNFGRDFESKWITKLGKKEPDIKTAEKRMEHLRKCEEEADDFAGPRDF
jgi:AAA domain